ncbi:hypothetical protein [Microbacterium sp. B24]|uniref:hypothetical protein n=1 Tax=Microbacterium sp. B24 TaxID=95616 RepID=UPI00055ACD92|nr:hypothetical protein [Microbacterium sp. B24]
MAQISIHIAFTYEGPRPDFRTTVEASEDALFGDVARGALRDAIQQELKGLYLVASDDGSWGVDDLIVIPDDFTVGEYAQITAAEEHALIIPGLGAGEFWFEPLMSAVEFIGYGLTIREAYSLMRSQGKQFRQLRYRTHQKLARDWLDDGKPQPIPMPLRQRVKEQNPWSREHFDFAFGLDYASGTELLRAAGYRKTREVPGDSVWTDETEPYQGQRYPGLAQ